MKGYGDDISYIHDVGFGGYVEYAAPGVLELMRGSGIEQGLVVDLGCGSGIWAKILVEAGYKVLGIDQSAEILAIARKRVAQGRFVEASFFRAKIPPCDVITSLGECLNYRFDQTNNIKTLKRLFKRAYDALRPGGLFVFDVVQVGYLRKSLPSHSFQEGKDWAILLKVERDAKARTLRRSIVSFRKVGTLYRRSEENHDLILYKSSELAKELRRVGFKVHYLRGYGQRRFSRRNSGFLARKPFA